MIDNKFKIFTLLIPLSVLFTGLFYSVLVHLNIIKTELHIEHIKNLTTVCHKISGYMALPIFYFFYTKLRILIREPMKYHYDFYKCMVIVDVFLIISTIVVATFENSLKFIFGITSLIYVLLFYVNKENIVVQWFVILMSTVLYNILFVFPHDYHRNMPLVKIAVMVIYFFVTLYDSPYE